MWILLGKDDKGEKVYLNKFTGKRHKAPHRQTGRITRRIPDYAFSFKGMHTVKGVHVDTPVL